MATIDEILDAMPEENAETGRDYLVIDPATRTITVPESESVFGVTGDELADRKYFMCPRYVGDGLDLAGMFIRVNYRNAGGDEDGYLVDDVAVVGDYVTFSWRLWPKVTEYMGTVHFGVCADLPNTAERRFPDWNTTMATGEVLEGLHPYDGAVEEETRDVVTQLRAETAAQTAAVAACGAEQVQAVKDTAAAETAASVAAIKAQGAATQASLPADYTALAAQVDKLTRDRAAAIVCQAEGTTIQVQDASNDPLQGLRIFGRSTQDGTPTPDNPVEIQSLPAPAVTVCGKNLLNVDEQFSFTGIAGFDVYLPAGEYILSFEGETHDGENPPEFRFYDNKSWNTLDDPQKVKVVTLSKPERKIYIYSNGTSSAGSTGVSASIEKLMVSKIGGDYEPYTGQTLAIATPGSLPGIPVASGGNYTDAAGKEWICDEVDLARGVYVQRVKQIELDASADEYWYTIQATGGTIFAYAIADAQAAGSSKLLYCSHFAPSVNGAYNKTENACYFYDKTFRVCHLTIDTLDDFKTWITENPITVLYQLAEPVETPLTDAELQAFLAMHSNKPTTTVLNDAGAHMALEYAADPKTYIDNKLAALVAAKN